MTRFDIVIPIHLHVLPHLTSIYLLSLPINTCTLQEVYDIAFACGKDVFGTVGADGSLRMFDLR